MFVDNCYDIVPQVCRVEINIQKGNGNLELITPPVNKVVPPPPTPEGDQKVFIRSLQASRPSPEGGKLIKTL